MDRRSEGKPLIVGFIGFSQSGKSSRIENILRLTGSETMEPAVYTRVYEKGTRHSRHFMPFASVARGRTIDTVLVTVDYTGHDHLAAYFFTRRILEALEKGLLGAGREALVRELVENAGSVVDELAARRGGLSKRLLLQLLDSPIPGYKYLRDYFDPYRELCGVIRGAPCRDEEVARVVEYVRQTLRETGRDMVSFNDLNRILCVLESSHQTRERCLDIGKADRVEIVVGEAGGYFARLVVTAPLLTHLLVGLLIESNILFILVPASIGDYLNQLKRLFMGDDSKSPHYLLAALRALAWAGEDVHGLLVKALSSTVKDKASGEDTGRIVEECLETTVEEEVDRLKLPRDAVQVVASAAPFTSINGYKGFIGCVSKALTGEAGGEGLDKGLTEALTRVVLEKYQVGLLEALLKLLGYIAGSGVKPVLSTVVFDYTYMDKARRPFKEIVSRSLSSSLLEFDRDTPALSEVYRLLRETPGLKGVDLEVYALPSSLHGSYSTPFEYMMLVCLLEDKLASFKVTSKDTGESREVLCVDLLKEMRLHHGAGRV